MRKETKPIMNRRDFLKWSSQVTAAAAAFQGFPGEFAAAQDFWDADTAAEGVQHLNPDSKRTVSARLEPSLRDARAAAPVQFERHGYFVVDSNGASAFNRTVSLRDSWASAKPS